MTSILADYSATHAALAVILATVLIQQLIASGKKAKAPGAVPGKMDESLGHDSVVFRTQRTWMNSLENLPAMLPAIGTAAMPPRASAQAARSPASSVSATMEVGPQLRVEPNNFERERT